VPDDQLRLWFWIVTDPITKRRRRTRYMMTEEEALARHGADAVKVEGSLEVRKRTNTHTGDFLRR
jgi:hypothetical protein